MTATADRSINTDFLIAQAHEARRDYEDSAKEYRTLLRREMELEAQRHIVKLQAARRLKKHDNPLTGKPFSGTGGEEYAAMEPTYAEHLTEQREVVFQKNAARTCMVSAKLRVELAIAAIKSNLGVL